MMTSNLTRAVAGLGAAAMLAAAAPALAADPTDTMLYIAGELTDQYDLPAGLLLAVAEVESDFDPSCRTGKCWGLMQIHSAYAAEYAKGAGLTDWDLFDPADSLHIAAYMLDDYLDRYQGDLHFALMAYNLGEWGALAKRRDGVETTSYSRKVVGRIEKWAVAGVPEVEAAPAAAEEAPAAAEEAARTARAFVTGVWQRVREVLFR